MLFHYRVRDPLGKSLEGTIEATSDEAARQQLARDGFQVHSLESAEGEPDFFPRRVSRQEIIYTTSQLSIMVDTGITLSAALAGVLEQEANPTLRRVLSELKAAVEGGEDFSTALARHPRLFNRTYVALVRASEATGTLGAMLETIATYLRKESETISRVRAAMAYPAVMMVLASGVTVFLLTYILPKFIPLFQSRGAELPGPTRLMMATSGILVHYWYAWLAGLLAAIAAVIVARRTAEGRRGLDWLKIHMPVVGKLVRKVTITRSIRTLGTMVGSGVPVLDALRLAGEVSGNFFYEQLWAKVLDDVSGGKRICESLQGNPLLPRVLVQMIASGEESGKLDVVLQRVSTYYDHDVETTIKATTSLIEPVLIAVMGAVVGTIGLALLLPIFSLSRHP